ncbi:hypothetical protein Psi02_04930 [Planotetraspora silvatica]|uniref:Uncharacterized protein n=1 Tax=Planotetraspora silvatica TaxID=234614 RepID=A0A8J3UKP9_9ACTN|nr:hypothetical protein Psi02_04930 [Planotetraspora silvatica]
MTVEAIAAKVVARTTLLAFLRMVLPFGRGASLLRDAGGVVWPVGGGVAARHLTAG